MTLHWDCSIFITSPSFCLFPRSKFRKDIPYGFPDGFYFTWILRRGFVDFCPCRKSYFCSASQFWPRTQSYLYDALESTFFCLKEFSLPLPWGCPAQLLVVLSASSSAFDHLLLLTAPSCGLSRTTARLFDRGSSRADNKNCFLFLHFFYLPHIFTVLSFGPRPQDCAARYARYLRTL